MRTYRKYIVYHAKTWSSGVKSGLVQLQSSRASLVVAYDSLHSEYSSSAVERTIAHITSPRHAQSFRGSVTFRDAI